MALAKPKRLFDGGSTPAHRRSRKQEAEVAARLGGRLTIASGALDTKGDVRVKRVMRVECKTTTKKSFSVTREMLGKIEEAALSAGEVPAMVIEFLTPKGKPESACAIVPMWVLDDFAQLAKDRNDRT